MNSDKTMQKSRAGLTSSTIKIIAIVAMFIDHFTAVFIGGYMASLPEESDILTYVYIAFRGIGRFAFPIFCFLLVEGFTHTSNLKKYIRNLLIFALVSELPFNIAFSNCLFDPSYQNVFFTLLIGITALAIIKYLPSKLTIKEEHQKIAYTIICMLATAACAALAQLLKTDYGAEGVICIVLMYLLRQYKTISFTVGVIFLTIMNYFEGCALLMIPVIKAYNGKRGLSLKYFFYAFYPVHMLLIWLLTYALGYASFAIR